MRQTKAEMQVHEMEVLDAMNDALDRIHVAYLRMRILIPQRSYGECARVLASVTPDVMIMDRDSWAVGHLKMLADYERLACL